MKFFFKKEALLFLFLSVFLFSFSNSTAEAQLSPGTTKLYGTAWSDNIGWISFNHCEVEQDGDLDCDPIEYNVEVGDLTGLITGEAWSDNIGWIKFGGLSSFPSGSGTVSNNTNINMLNGAITGWVRACAGTVDGDCSTMESRVDGWDGWVSLSGSFHTSPDLSGNGGVTFDSANNRIIGKAWGGPVIGWIDFVDVRYGPIPPDLGPIEYTLTNSTENSPTLEIARDATGTFSVTRTWISGSNETIGLFTPSSLDDENITFRVDTNNPCEIGEEYQECSSTIYIDVNPIATIDDYTFSVIGLNPLGQDPHLTTVMFTVTEALPDPPVISCEVSGSFWLYQPITWIADDDGAETPIWYWQGSEDMSSCESSQECVISYSTVGTKTAEVSINGQVGPFTECDPINIGAKLFFEEI